MSQYLVKNSLKCYKLKWNRPSNCKEWVNFSTKSSDKMVWYRLVEHSVQLVIFTLRVFVCAFPQYSVTDFICLRWAVVDSSSWANSRFVKVLFCSNRIVPSVVVDRRCHNRRALLLAHNKRAYFAFRCIHNRAIWHFAVVDVAPAHNDHNSTPAVDIQPEQTHGTHRSGYFCSRLPCYRMALAVLVQPHLHSTRTLTMTALEAAEIVFAEVIDTEGLTQCFHYTNSMTYRPYLCDNQIDSIFSKLF